MRVCACGPLSVCLSHSHSHTQTYTHTLSLSLSVQPTQVTVVTAREAKVPEDMLVIAGVGCIKFFSLTGQPLGSHSDDHMDQNDGAPVSIRLDLELSLSRPLSTSLSFDLSLSQPLDLSRPLSTSLLTSLLTSLSFAHAPQFFAPPSPLSAFPIMGRAGVVSRHYGLAGPHLRRLIRRPRARIPCTVPPPHRRPRRRQLANHLHRSHSRGAALGVLECGGKPGGCD